MNRLSSSWSSAVSAGLRTGSRGCFVRPFAPAATPSEPSASSVASRASGSGVGDRGQKVKRELSASFKRFSRRNSL